MIPYIGEIQIYAGVKPPGGWAWCDGATLPISENETLFNLIGTTYGGDGQETFMLPDLRGRVPVHMGGGSIIGMTGGVETVTLTVDSIPAHYHFLMCTTDPATASTVANNVPASMPAAGTGSAYGSVPPFRPIDPSSLGHSGGGEAHNNVQPFLCVGYIISLFGQFPNPT
jgi:microcystin-dependent protein